MANCAVSVALDPAGRVCVFIAWRAWLFALGEVPERRSRTTTDQAHLIGSLLSHGVVFYSAWRRTSMRRSPLKRMCTSASPRCNNALSPPAACREPGPLKIATPAMARAGVSRLPAWARERSRSSSSDHRWMPRKGSSSPPDEGRQAVPLAAVITSGPPCEERCSIGSVRAI